MAFDPEQDLESLLKTDTLVFYNHSEERKETGERAKGRDSCYDPSGVSLWGSRSWKEESEARGLLPL